MSHYYQSDGKVTPQSIIYLLIVAFTLIPILSFLFALSGIEISYAVFKFFFPLVFAVLVGASINMALIGFGKTRNGFAGFILSSMATVWAYYLYWIFYFVYISDGNHAMDFSAIISAEGSGFFQKTWYLVKSPALVWQILKNYSAIGNWQIFGMAINGGVLIFLLVVEFIVIYLLSTFIGFMNYDRPFDELNKQWFKYDFLENEKYFLPEDNLVSRLEMRNYKDLLNQNNQISEAGKRYFSGYTLYHNGSQNYLSVENIIATLENGKWNRKTTELVRYIEISPEFAAELRSKNKKILEIPDSTVSNMNYYQNLTK